MIVDFLKNSIGSAVFARIPFGVLQNWSRVSPLVPYYHGVSDEQPPHVKYLYQFKNVRQFKNDLDTLLRLFKPIDFHQLFGSVKSHRPLARNSLLLTFDDGFREIYDVITPILREKGVPATFFLITECLDNMGMPHQNKASLLINHLGRMGTTVPDTELLRILSERGFRSTNLRTALLSVDYANKDLLDTIAAVLGYDFAAYLRTSRPYLTSEQVRKLISMGFTIGAHSIDHPQYSLIPFQEQLRQTRGSIRALRERFSLNYGAFAFPHGDDNLSDQFFKQISADGEVDASFGNYGLVRDLPPWNFLRLPMENVSAPAEEVIGHYYAKSLYDFAVRRRVSVGRRLRLLR